MGQRREMKRGRKLWLKEERGEQKKKRWQEKSPNSLSPFQLIPRRRRKTLVLELHTDQDQKESPTDPNVVLMFHVGQDIELRLG